MRILDDVIKAIHDMHQPVIGAINGPAIGGGFCLAMATDIRIAAEQAYFRPAGINNGLTSAELGLSYLLPRAIGTSRAFEIMLTGRDVDATEAERIGVVSRVVPRDKLLEECYAIAERINGFSQLGVELSKQMLWAGVDAGSRVRSGSRSMTFASTSVISAPGNARVPVSISYRTTPNAQMSARRSTALPRACSGGM